MTNKIILDSKVPVVAPGETIHLSAKVFAAEDGTLKEGVKINWTFHSSSTQTKLGEKTSTTSAEGYAENTVTSPVEASVIITATLDDGSNMSTTLNVGFYSSKLNAPKVPQAHNGILTEKDIKGLVQAMVERHTDDPSPGDYYNFYWGRDFISRIDDGTSETFPWVINVKNIFTEAEVLADGNYTIYYTVTDLARNVSYSQPLAITVTGGTYVNPIYDAPEFPKITDNTINYEDIADGGVNVEILLPQSRESEGAHIFAGNTITLYMRVFDKNHKTEIIPTKSVVTRVVDQKDIANHKISLTIPKDMVTDKKDTFDDVRGYFWFTVTGEGSVSVAGSSYTKTLIIDTVPPHFNKL